MVDRPSSADELVLAVMRASLSAVFFWNRRCFARCRMVETNSLQSVGGDARNWLPPVRDAHGRHVRSLDRPVAQPYSWPTTATP